MNVCLSGSVDTTFSSFILLISILQSVMSLTPEPDLDRFQINICQLSVTL